MVTATTLLNTGGKHPKYKNGISVVLAGMLGHICVILYVWYTAVLKQGKNIENVVTVHRNTLKLIK